VDSAGTNHVLKMWKIRDQNKKVTAVLFSINPREAIDRFTDYLRHGNEESAPLKLELADYRLASVREILGLVVLDIGELVKNLLLGEHDHGTS